MSQDFGVDSQGVITYNRYLNNPYKRFKVSDSRMSLPAIGQAQARWMGYGRAGYTKKKRKLHKYFERRKVDRGIIPLEKRGWLKWVSDDLTYTAGAATGSINFSLNSVYDPGAALTDVRPQYWTEISAIWKCYKVFLCSFHLHLSNTTAEQVKGSWCMVQSSEVCPGTAAGLTENIQKGGHMFFVGATDENLTNHTDLHGIWKLHNYAKLGDKDWASYGAEVTTSPAQQYYLNVNLSSAANIVVMYRAVFNFWVEFNTHQQNAPD